VLYAALARALPWYAFIPIGAALAVIHLYIESRHVGDRYQEILDGVQRIHGESIGDITRINPSDIDRTIYKAFKELATELERKNFQLVEKNIQLLSIKEIGLTIVSSIDEAKVVDAVINFLSKGLEYREMFIAILRHDDEIFNFYTFRDAVGGQEIDRHEVALSSIDGLIRKSAQMQHSLLIRDPLMHPMGKINGNPLFTGSTMTSYVVVPLVKSGATQDCDKRENCILHMNQVERETTCIEGNYSCPACGRVPLLGLVGVTDGFKASALSRVDQVSVETLAVQLSTMLENNRLFSDLRQEEAFRDNVINSMMNGLVTTDTSGTILYANERAAEISGYPANDLRGRSVSEIIRRARSGGGDSPVDEALARGRSVQQEALLVRSDGHRAPIVINTSFLRSEHREIEGALTVFDDISSLKRMEEQIVHLDKLAALGRLSSSIAHEIRNPLTGIAAGIQYLQRSGRVDDEQKENVKFILEEVNRIDRLIADLMNVVRISDLIYVRIDLANLMENCVRSVEDLASSKSVTLTIDVPDDAPRVRADSDRITQVLINLLKNAIEAVPRGGHVSLAVEVPEDTSDVVFDVVQDFVIIKIHDDGPGLTDEDKKQVFEPFFSRKADGTGLGLYVVHSIIERHGGYIYVDSESGRGSTFTIYLPVEQAQHGDTSPIGHPVS